MTLLSTSNRRKLHSSPHLNKTTLNKKLASDSSAINKSKTTTGLSKYATKEQNLSSSNNVSKFYKTKKTDLISLKKTKIPKLTRNQPVVPTKTSTSASSITLKPTISSSAPSITKSSSTCLPETKTKKETEIVEKNPMTIEDFESQENSLNSCLFELNSQLSELYRLKTNPSLLKTDQLSTQFKTILDYRNDYLKLENESSNNLLIVNLWYNKQKTEIEQQFKTELNKSNQEYDDKRRELKESLKNEHEEMKKQIEVDRAVLDINMDVSEPKPAPTRNLRRRYNANAFDYSTADINNSDIVGSGAGLASNSVLLQSSIQVGTSISSSGVSVASGNLLSSTYGQIGTAVSGGYYYASQPATYLAFSQTAFISNSSSQNINDRKRKINSAIISLPVTDDEISEDLKFLSKNLNNHTIRKSEPEPVEDTSIKDNNLIQVDDKSS